MRSGTTTAANRARKYFLNSDVRGAADELVTNELTLRLSPAARSAMSPAMCN
jgi:hypothetical protein